MGWAILIIALVLLIGIGLLTVLWAILSFLLRTLFIILLVIIVAIAIYTLVKRFLN